MRILTPRFRRVSGGTELPVCLFFSILGSSSCAFGKRWYIFVMWQNETGDLHLTHSLSLCARVCIWVVCLCALVCICCSRSIPGWVFVFDWCWKDFSGFLFSAGWQGGRLCDKRLMSGWLRRTPSSLSLSVFVSARVLVCIVSRCVCAKKVGATEVAAGLLLRKLSSAAQNAVFWRNVSQKVLFTDSK